MPNTLQIDTTLTDTVGLMYFDPTDEVLRELDAESVYFSLKPYEINIRRFYLCGDLIYYPNNIKINVRTSDLDLYEAKIKLGTVDTRISSFDNATDEVIIDTEVLNTYYTNAIPVDLLLISKTTTEKVIELEIELSVTEQQVACVPTNISFSSNDPLVIEDTVLAFKLSVDGGIASIHNVVIDTINNADRYNKLITLIANTVTSEVNKNIYGAFDASANGIFGRTYTPNVMYLIDTPTELTFTKLTPQEITTLENNHSGYTIQDGFDLIEFGDLLTATSATVTSCAYQIGL